MQVYQRGKRGIYWVRATLAGGQRIKRSTGTADEESAKEWAARLVADSWRTKRLGDAPSVTWEEAVLSWMQTYGGARRSIENMKDRLRWLTGQLGGRDLRAIDGDTLTRALDKLQVENSTRNGYLAEARKILRYAVVKRWLTAAPVVKPYPVVATDYRWLTHEQAAALLAELPEHLAAMARFSLATGLRESNVRLLKWRNVDTARRVAWVLPGDAKAGKSIAVPLNDDALATLQACRSQHNDYVFTYLHHDGKRHPTGKCSNHAWYKATRRAGVEGLRWHDLRHTWATWHVMRNTPLPVLQKLGGWASLAMVMRYSHVGVDYAAQFADGSLLPRGTNSAHIDGADPGHHRNSLNSLGWPMGLEPTTTGITKGSVKAKLLNIKDALARKTHKTA